MGELLESAGPSVFYRGSGTRTHDNSRESTTETPSINVSLPPIRHITRKREENPIDLCQNLPVCLGYHGLQGSTEGRELLLYMSKISLIASGDRLQGHPILLHRRAEGWVATGLHRGTGTIGPIPSPYPGGP